MKKQFQNCNRSDASQRRRGFSLIELLVSTAVISILISLLLPAVQVTREAARKTQCRSQMRQLGIALHNFHDVYRVFPASGWTVPGPGNPSGAYISWRAAILPYLEQTALHESYDLRSDWWAAQNLSAGANAVTLYKCPSTPTQPAPLLLAPKSPRPELRLGTPLARADYEAIMGVREAIAPARYTSKSITRSVLHRNSTVRIADIIDGTSTTIVLTECAGRPAVYRGRQSRTDLSNEQGNGWIDSESAFSLDGASADGSMQGQGPQLTPHGINVTNENEPYSFHEQGAFFLFADGHVEMLNQDIDLSVLAAMVTRAAGEVVTGQ
jgi:prepilin-type N-terminal cleavage/methylation domain-containing protein/prepilin-type processing-associated H-X9-DG protein